ncbi:MAG: Crp/Fnr family transcriptional regulator [Leptolyngbyaceae bacterium]|nr:Crp/Fnr family transcriptional regulator [Leptolyngbyaceae bacterium]
MRTDVFNELFPLFNVASTETLSKLEGIVVKHDYPASRAVLMEDAWGNAVYFIESGWVKVRRHSGEDKVVTLAILGKGDFFGEMAILDESPRSTDVIALSSVSLFSISAQQFIQMLFEDAQLHHRMLQLMVQRLRYTNIRLQMRRQPPAIKLAYALLNLAQQYGMPSEIGPQILNIPAADLADISDTSVEDTQKIVEKLQEKGLIEIDSTQQLLCLRNERQLVQLLRQQR